MSKAFTKDEGEARDAAELEIDPLAGLPEGAKNYITADGATAFREEIQKLASSREEAAARRVRFLERVLETAEVVPAHQTPDRVLFGVSVRVANDDGDETKYRIVGLAEADPANGKISWTSPLAKALLNKQAGDVTIARTPAGEQELEILAIETGSPAER